MVCVFLLVCMVLVMLIERVVHSHVIVLLVILSTLVPTVFLCVPSSNPLCFDLVLKLAELTWLGFLLRDLGIPLLSPPQLFFHNVIAICLTMNLMFNAHVKHIDIDYHFVREKVSSFFYIPSFIHVADIFTKSLSRSSFELIQSKLGVLWHSLHNLRGHVKDAHSKDNLLHTHG